MMKIIIAFVLLVCGLNAGAQISKASLQASGLTCSMCSKAVKEALEEVSFVEKVQVDIKNQQYNLSFKEGSEVEPDLLARAVEDAGFSVASLKVTANVIGLKLKKDEHVQIGNKSFHFLNGEGQELKGMTTFSVVDKNFVSSKEFKKYSSLTSLSCIQTGVMEECCTKSSVASSRVYHVIL